MNKRTIAVADVRNICVSLVNHQGDVYEASLETGFSMDLIKRIKEKKYMKAISDSYFNTSDWGDISEGVREPERVVLNTSDLEDNTSASTITEPKVEESTTTETTTTEEDETMSKKRLNNGIVQSICLDLCNGLNNSEIVERYGVTTQCVSTIRHKKTYREISDKFFTLKNGDIVPIKHTPKVEEPVTPTISTTEPTTVETPTEIVTTPTPEPIVEESKVKEFTPSEKITSTIKKTHRKSKLTTKAINKICKDLASGVTGRAIAKKFGIARGTVSNIKLKYRYKEISDKYFVLNEFGNIVPVSDAVRDVNNTVQINLSSSDAIINEIYDLTTQLLMKKPIEQLPDRIQEKILLILKEEVDNMSIKDIKEMIINE